MKVFTMLFSNLHHKIVLLLIFSTLGSMDSPIKKLTVIGAIDGFITSLKSIKKLLFNKKQPGAELSQAQSESLKINLDLVEPNRLIWC